MTCGLLAAVPAAAAERIMVAPRTLPCAASSAGPCLRVKAPLAFDWRELPGGIAGYVHEEGTAVLLLVDGPADAPVLVETITLDVVPADQAGVLEALAGYGTRP